MPRTLVALEVAGIEVEIQDDAVVPSEYRIEAHHSDVIHRPRVAAVDDRPYLFVDQLRKGRKTATIRLGDKSGKYKKGMVVKVLCGVRFGAREHVFDAVIDKVEVKKLAELSPKEIEHDNPEARRPEELAIFLGQLYNREISSDEIVTLIRFSEIRA